MSKKKGNKLKPTKVDPKSEKGQQVKVVKTSKAKEKSAKLDPVRSRVSSRQSAGAAPAQLLFNKKNYILMLAGIGLVILGLLLMTGGRNIDPNVFDDNVIYSFRRITLGPICILAGLIVEVFAIFK